jgi:integrase
MPRLALTDRFVANVKATSQIDYFDEKTKGLSLRVSPGAKTWTFHYRWQGKRARATLGSYPATSLGEARTRAIEARGAVEAGNDPRHRSTGAETVAGLVESYITGHVVRLRSRKDAVRRLRKNIVPVIGGVKLAELHRRDATRVIDTVMKRDAPIEAARAFEDLRAMLRWAVARGDLDHNPIDGMRKPATSKPRERVLSEEEIRTLWLGLPQVFAKSPTCQRIIRLCLITAQRVGEVAGMQRSELDLKRRLWSLPGARTKNGHPHRVPLSERAMEISREAEGGGEAIFDLSPHAVAKAIGRGRFGLAPFTSHDLRRTALTEMAKLGVAPIVLGHVANHRTVTKAGMTLAVYVQHQYEAEKRAALDLWADRLSGIIGGGAEVVPMVRDAAKI